MKLNTALVTGGAGFIGTHIVEELIAQNIETYVIDDFSSGKAENLEHLMRNKLLHLIVGDVRDVKELLKDVNDIDVVFHEAAIASVPASITNPWLVHDTNVNMSLEVLDFCLKSNIKKLIFASSAAVYGDLNVAYHFEDLPCRPTSPYGASKLAVEGYLHSFAKSYGIDTTALRYFNVYGPKQANTDGGVIQIFANKLLKKESPVINGDGRQCMDFVHVNDIVQANILAAKSNNSSGETLNVGTGRSTSVVELFELLRRIVDVDVQPRYGPPRAGDSRFSRASIDKIKRILGYSPKVSINQGLADIVESRLRGVKYASPLSR